ncbi:MAG: DNA repair protein RadC [SAR324 cluster bacterium]|nr:DNA repair protein RadC [SAR324 cluster bacterium]
MSSKFFSIIRDYYQNSPAYEEIRQFIVNEPALYQIPRQEFSHDFLNTLLPLLGIPWRPSSSRRELQPVYGVLDTINPHYFRSEQILSKTRILTHLKASQQQLIGTSLIKFIQIIRATELQTHKLGTAEMQSLWIQIWTPSQAWAGFSFLQSWNIPVAASLKGNRCWQRFKHGKNQHDGTPDLWMKTCTEEATMDIVSADLLSGAFSGDLKPLGVPSICEDIPNCECCPLNQECLFFVQKISNSTETASSTKTELHNKSTAELLTEIIPEASIVIDSLGVELDSDSLLRHLDRKTPRELFLLARDSLKLTGKLTILLELCKRYNEHKLVPGKAFQASVDVFRHFQHRLRELKQEVFLVILLDNKHQYLTDCQITQGLLNKSLVHPREVFASAIEHRAAAIIAIHNHPSGDPRPSSEDIQITRRLQDTGKIVGIPLLDHVIIGRDQYCSLADEGLMQEVP